METGKGFNQAIRFLPMAMAILLFSAAATESRVNIAEEEKHGNQIDSWCIVKPSTDETKLKANIDYSCSQLGVDCRLIEENGICYKPVNLVSHASVAMNLYYKSAGKHSWNCDFGGTGLTITQNPSVDYCVYPL